MEGTHQYALRMPVPVYEWLQEQGKRIDRPVSWIINSMLAEAKAKLEAQEVKQ
jgi:hypothetical protein